MDAPASEDRYLLPTSIIHVLLPDAHEIKTREPLTTTLAIAEDDDENIPSSSSLGLVIVPICSRVILVFRYLNLKVSVSLVAK